MDGQVKYYLYSTKAESVDKDSYLSRSLVFSSKEGFITHNPPKVVSLFIHSEETYKKLFNLSLNSLFVLEVETETDYSKKSEFFYFTPDYIKVENQFLTLYYS